MLARWGAVLTCALVTGVLTMVPSTAFGALPSVCSGVAGLDVYVWKGGNPADHDWMNAANWQRPDGSPVAAAPNDNRSYANPISAWTPGQNGDTANTVACVSIPAGQSDYVFLDNSDTAYVWVQQLHVEGEFAIQLKPENTGLLVMGTATSTLGLDSSVDAQGTFGGAATISTLGSVRLASAPGVPGTLSSQKIGEPDFGYGGGTLVVQPGAHLDLDQGGTALRDRYTVDLRGDARLSGSAYLAADDATAFTIAASGTLTLAGEGGYYQGVFATPRSLSALTNNGRLVKDGPGVSVVDAAYIQPSGRIEVVSGTLSFPGGPSYAARVEPSARLSTEQCAPRAAAAPCTVALSGSGDPQSAAFTAPIAEGAGVELEETTVPATSVVGPQGVQNVVELHTTGLSATPADPAVLELRTDTVAAGTSDLGQLDVVREADDLSLTTLADCQPSGAPPVGQVACVDRRGLAISSRVEGRDVYLVVRTTANSRYIIRKEQVVVAPPVIPVTPLTPLPPAPQLVTVDRSAGRVVLRKLKLAVTYSQSCQLSAAGRLKVRGAKGLGYQALTLAVAPGVPTPVTLTADAKTKKRLRSLEPTRAKAVVSLTCTDALGQASVATSSFRLS